MMKNEGSQTTKTCQEGRQWMSTSPRSTTSAHQILNFYSEMIDEGGIGFKKMKEK